MKLGELLARLNIEDQTLPVKYSDGSGHEDSYAVHIRLHGHGLLKDYRVESVDVSPYGVHIVATAADESAIVGIGQSGEEISW